MDKKTHETITATIKHIDGVQVLPLPQGDEDLLYLTITTPEGIHASEILNALNRDNLMGRTAIEARTMMTNPRPELGIVGLTSAGITFVHRNHNGTKPPRT